MVEALLAMKREGILRSQEVVRAQILRSRAKSLDAVVFSVSLNQYFTACSPFFFMACLLFLLL